MWARWPDQRIQALVIIASILSVCALQYLSVRNVVKPLYSEVFYIQLAQTTHVKGVHVFHIARLYSSRLRWERSEEITSASYISSFVEVERLLLGHMFLWRAHKASLLCAMWLVTSLSTVTYADSLMQSYRNLNWKINSFHMICCRKFILIQWFNRNTDI